MEARAEVGARAAAVAARAEEAEEARVAAEERGRATQVAGLPLRGTPLAGVGAMPRLAEVATSPES